MTLEETLKSFKSAFTGQSKELDSAKATIASLQNENAALNAEFAKQGLELKKLSAISAERDAALLKLDEMTKALEAAERQKLAAVEQIEDVGEKAAKIAASVGVNPVEIAANAEESKSASEVWDEYVKIGDPAQKLAFYNKNRARIMEHLGIR